MDLIWANSGDSHFLEREDLYAEILPPDLAQRMPRAVKDPDGSAERIRGFRRAMKRQFEKQINECCDEPQAVGEIVADDDQHEVEQHFEHASLVGDSERQPNVAVLTCVGLLRIDEAQLREIDAEKPEDDCPCNQSLNVVNKKKNEHVCN